MFLSKLNLDHPDAFGSHQQGSFKLVGFLTQNQLLNVVHKLSVGLRSGLWKD